MWLSSWSQYLRKTTEENVEQNQSALMFGETVSNQTVKKQSSLQSIVAILTLKESDVNGNVEVTPSTWLQLFSACTLSHTVTHRHTETHKGTHTDRQTDTHTHALYLLLRCRCWTRSTCARNSFLSSRAATFNTSRTASCKSNDTPTCHDNALLIQTKGSNW